MPDTCSVCHKVREDIEDHGTHLVCMECYVQHCLDCFDRLEDFLQENTYA